MSSGIGTPNLQLSTNPSEVLVNEDLGGIKVTRRTALNVLAALIGAGGSVIVTDTRAQLFALLNYGDKTGAFVVNDPGGDAINGIYIKSGAAGSGSWSRSRGLLVGPPGPTGATGGPGPAGPSPEFRVSNGVLQARLTPVGGSPGAWTDVAPIAALVVTPLAGPSMPDGMGYTVVDSEGRPIYGVSPRGVALQAGYGLDYPRLSTSPKGYVQSAPQITINAEGRYACFQYDPLVLEIYEADGQSLALATKVVPPALEGSAYDTPISTVPKHPEHALMPRTLGTDRGMRPKGADIIDFQPLVERNYAEVGSRAAESHLSTIINGLCDREKECFGLCNRKIAVIFAQGATTLKGITRGNPAWEHRRKGLEDICRVARAKGWRPVIKGRLLSHGESDSGAGTTFTEYRNGLIEHIGAARAEGGRITGQSEQIHYFVCQVPRGSNVLNGEGFVAQAQASMQDREFVTVIGNYHFVRVNPLDAVHPDNFGYLDIGHRYLNAIWQKFYGRDYQPLQIEKVVWTSNTNFTLTFNKPVVVDRSDLWIKVSNLVNPAGCGLDFLDGTANPPTVTSLVNPSPNTGVLTFKNEERGKDGGTTLAGVRAIHITAAYMAWVACGDRDSVALIDLRSDEFLFFITELVDGARLNGARAIASYHGYLLVACYDSDSVQVVDTSRTSEVYMQGEVVPPPLLVGQIKGPADGSLDGTALDGATDIKTYQQYAFVTTYNRASLAVINAADPLNLVWVGEERGASPGTTMAGASGLAIRDGHKRMAYVACAVSNSLVTVDISNPLAPSTAAVYKDDTILNGACAAAMLSDKYVIVCNRVRDGIAVFRVFDPAAPAPPQSAPYDPVNPVFVTEFRGPSPGVSLDGARCIEIVGTVAYIGCSSLDKPGFVVAIDVSDPANPVYIAEYQGTTPGTTLAGISAIKAHGADLLTANADRASVSRFFMPLPGRTLNGTLSAPATATPERTFQYAQRYTTIYNNRETGTRGGLRGPFPLHRSEIGEQILDHAIQQRIRA